MTLTTEASALDLSCIQNRIDAALEKMAWQRLRVRAIYLQRDDLAALHAKLDAAASTYRGHPVRIGYRSLIDSYLGIQIKVPMRLSHRVGIAPQRVAA